MNGITRKVRHGASGDEENIIVAGGVGTFSVEMFDWQEKLWSPLQDLPEVRFGSNSFVFDHHVTLAGRYGPYADIMIRMKVDPKPDLSVDWVECPARLPARLQYSSGVLHNDRMLVTGGYDTTADVTSDRVEEVQLLPPYATKSLARMPGPRQNHCTEIFDDSVLIVGGCTTNHESEYQILKSFLRYDIKKKECTQLAPLPYEVCDMATVKWGDNVVVIGGVDKHGNMLDTVSLYNVKTEQSRMLPPMRCAKHSCAAVVVENNIVVLGGASSEVEALKSVEAFDFDSYTWKELPEMSKGRRAHTAVVV